MTNREFRKHLHQKRLEAIRAEVLAEKKKPPASEKATKVREKSKKAQRWPNACRDQGLSRTLQ
jgi:hypothetical protein